MIRSFFFLIAVILLSWNPCSGQAPTDPPTPVDSVTSETIDARLKQVEADTQLDEDTKKKIRERYEQVRADLELIKSNQASLQKFQQQLSTAKEDLEKAKQKRAAQSKSDAEQPAVNGATLSELEQELTRREETLKEKTETRAQLDAEPKRRSVRLEEIPGLLSEAKDKLQQIETQLDAPFDPATATALDQANRTTLPVRKDVLTTTTSLLEAERAAYEATAELLQVRRDITAAEFEAAEADAKRWRALVNERRKKEAADQATEARRAALRASPALAELAQEVADLAEQRKQLAEKISKASKELESSRAALTQVSTEYERAKEKVGAGGLSHASGQILRQQRSSLPDLRKYRRHTRARQPELQDARFNEYDYQDRRLGLANLDARAEELLSQLETKVSSDMESDVRELLRLKRDNLEGLIADFGSYAKVLLELNDVEKQLIDTTQQYEAFIDERVLWIRSAFTLNHRDLRPALDALSWLTRRSNWAEVGREMVPDSRLQAVLFGLSVLAFISLIYLRNLTKRTLIAVGESVSRRGFFRFAPTVRALGLTAVISAVWPGILFFLAWRFYRDLSAADFVRALGTACVVAASVWCPLEFFRQTCRPGGLADSHFQWPAPALQVVRKRVQGLVVVGLPVLLLSLTLEYQTTEPLWGSSLGRVAFIVLLILTAVFFDRLFRGKGGAVQNALSPISGRLPAAVRWAWTSVFVITPLVLAVLAAMGYYDTSQALAVRLFATAGLAFALLLLHALLARWVLMRRRNLAIEQARQRRAASATDGAPATQAQDPAMTAAAMQDVAEEVDLGSVSQQSVKLVRTFVVAAGITCGWLIWDDVFPALSILDNYPAWPGATELTVADVLLAVAVMIVTYVATRNVPGLLELTLLNYLPVDAGARFATTTICRYLIAGAGVAIAGRCVDITWSSIQWLIAAMGIGLGFGLQEIFANFISGIILLFERPIRVGDIITLGETTGIVTRIRMRATTITDWDRKEFVVPNKDLITGRLLNWTLTDQTNRIVIQVGVAYGSDTERARQLLLQVADDHPLILKDPAPIATFEGFGDSTLNLILRCYLPDLQNRLPTINDLHTAIDRAFRGANIEIAFPQRDIHVRTIDQPLKTVDERVADELHLR